jgi:hypothetical protein
MDPPHSSHAGKLPFQRNFPVFPSHLAVPFAQMLEVITFNSKRDFELANIGQRELGGKTI